MKYLNALISPVAVPQPSSCVHCRKQFSSFSKIGFVFRWKQPRNKPSRKFSSTTSSIFIASVSPSRIRPKYDSHNCCVPNQLSMARFTAASAKGAIKWPSFTKSFDNSHEQAQSTCAFEGSSLTKNSNKSFSSALPIPSKIQSSEKYSGSPEIQIMGELSG